MSGRSRTSSARRTGARRSGASARSSAVEPEAPTEDTGAHANGNGASTNGSRRRMNGSAASIDSVRAATAYDASGNGAHGNGAHGNGAHGNGASHHGAADGAASNGSATVDGVPDVDGLGPAGRALAGHVHEMLALLGEAPSRPGLRKTPLRVANALAWLTRGYGQSVAAVVGDAVFPERHESMVMVRDIELYSLCEHHLLPFFGKAHIAYIPAGRIVGLSKLPRLVEVFARRLQVQERLTEEIADAIEAVLAPKGVGVVLECAHLCMMMRGVEKQNSTTITSALRGEFRTCPMTRDEFLRLAHGGGRGSGRTG